MAEETSGPSKTPKTQGMHHEARLCFMENDVHLFQCTNIRFRGAVGDGGKEAATAYLGHRSEETTAVATFETKVNVAADGWSLLLELSRSSTFLWCHGLRKAPAPAEIGVSAGESVSGK